MAASYPGNIKSFSTKAPGQAIASSHINDLQNEVVAVETQLGVNAGIWQSWTPTVTGWAAGYTCNARYCKVGKMVSVKIRILGTSNSTNVYVTLPVTSALDGVFAWAYAMNNGAAEATPAYVVLDSTSRIRVLLDATGRPWTASGGKRVMTTFTYEAA